MMRTRNAIACCVLILLAGCKKGGDSGKAPEPTGQSPAPTVAKDDRPAPPAKPKGPTTPGEIQAYLAKGGKNWSAPTQHRMANENYGGGDKIWIWPVDGGGAAKKGDKSVLKIKWRFRPGVSMTDEEAMYLQTYGLFASAKNGERYFTRSQGGSPVRPGQTEGEFEYYVEPGTIWKDGVLVLVSGSNLLLFTGDGTGK